FSLLTNSGNGLNVQRAAADVASNNVQNANTPGYSRQSAVLEATLPGERVGDSWLGAGVRLQTITQARDRFLEAQLPAASGAAARSAAESDVLASVSALDADAAGGLTSALGNFYAGLRALSQSPGDFSLRQQAVGYAQELTSAFRSAAAGLQAARDGVDARVQGQLPELNQVAAQIAAYNKDVRTARAQGGEPNDLLDARQRAVDRLVELT